MRKRLRISAIDFFKELCMLRERDRDRLQIPSRENCFTMSAEYTQLQLTFLALEPWSALSKPLLYCVYLLCTV